MHTYIMVKEEKFHVKWKISAFQNDCECLFEKLKSICVKYGTKSRDKNRTEQKSKRTHIENAQK